MAIIVIMKIKVKQAVLLHTTKDSLTLTEMVT